MAGREARQSCIGATRARDDDRGKSMLAAVASPVIIQIMRFPRAGTSCASDETARTIVS
jgi:hypothetical protein